jgi:murein L,D-transpeptidase YafK
MRFPITLWPAALAAGLLPLLALASQPTSEQRLGAAVEMLGAGQTDEALKALEVLTRQQPPVPLAHLLYGELLAAIGGPHADAPAAPASDSKLQDLAEEARLRLVSEKAIPPPGSVPNAVLQLADIHKYLIAVDLPRARLYLLENKDGQMSLVRHHYAAMGKNGYGKQSAGDARTPVGVYHVTGWIGDNVLPELYGGGAFPLNYPNLWDQFKRRSGSGIWLHGVPRDTVSRPPRSSQGCVTMANDDLLALKPYIKLGQTPVLLSDQLEWLKPDEVRDARDAFNARIEDWRKHWESRDTAGYLAFYGDDFTTTGMNRTAFAAHKKRVNASKKFIQITLSDVNLFRYPGTDVPLMLAEFTMDYRSDNYKVVSQKQQYWKQTPRGEWKIFREENR